MVWFGALRSWLAIVVLCGCHTVFGLDVVPPPPPNDAADAPDAAAPLLTPWTPTTALPTGRDYSFQHAAFVGETLYVIGGLDTSVGSETDVVYRATASEGSVGTWTETTPLPAPRALGDIVTIGTRIFVVGGANGGVAQTTVYCGEPDAGGSIPSWALASALPDARKAHAVAAANGYLYAVGGADASNARHSTVFYATVESNCGLGSWQVTTALPVPRSGLGVVAARGFLYAIAGDESDSVRHATVYVASLDPNNGQAGPWTATTPLPLARRGIVAVTDGSYIYVIGGADASATGEVRYSQIADDGTLGIWETSEPLLMPRFRHSGVLANGRLFVLGGALANTSVEQSAQGAL